MGSVGVQTGRGRITSDQVQMIRDSSGTIRGRWTKANSLVIYPNNFTTLDALRKSSSKYGSDYDIANAVRGYAVAMTGASTKQKDNFIRAFNKQVRLEERNTQRTVDRVLRQADARGANEATKRVLEEVVRSTAQRNLVDKIINKDRANGNKLFGGNIRTRRLRKTDF